jgi:hypothetical protein
VEPDDEWVEDDDDTMDEFESSEMLVGRVGDSIVMILLLELDP